MASLETIGIWAGIVGCGLGVVALPTAFQMFWGSPSLSLSFHEDAGPHSELRCVIHNAPVANGLLRALRVYRTEPDVGGIIEVHLADSTEILESISIIFDEESYSHKVSVQDGAVFTVAHLSGYRRKIIVGSIGHEDSDSVVLPDGNYDVVIRLGYSGHTKTLCKRVIVRGEHAYPADNSFALEVF